jgi:hypothetical protein
MATQIQYRRGTNAQNAAFTGALAEITVDTTNGTLRVHDGITSGGSNIATVAYVTSQISALSANSISSGTSNVRVVSSGGNVATSVGGTSNVMVVSSTDVTITGNLTVTGNATLSGNILGDRIQNGTTTIDIQSTGGNANITVGGTSNVAVFATTGAFITGLQSVTGNIDGGNLRTAGLISATSTITSAANITGGNILTAGLISATGAVTGAAITGTSLTVSTGNITGGNLLLSGAILDSAQLDIQTTASNANIALAPNGTGIVTVSTQVSAVGNVTGGNVRTAGLISATGAVTGSQFNGSGAGLTSIPNSALSNSSITVNGTAISLGGSGTITATATGTLTIGTGLGGTSYNGSTGVTITNTGVLSLANGGGITASVSTGAITLGSTATSANTAGAIVARGASGEFSAGVITATATSARYADLAEKYTADAEYAPGTVLIFGGTAEVTVSAVNSDVRVAGIVSTNPGFLMNESLDAEFLVALALTGRVPCQVVGNIVKGDRLVSSDQPGVATVLDPDKYQPGCIIGKALENYNSQETGIIEVAVGRF